MKTQLFKGVLVLVAGMLALLGCSSDQPKNDAALKKEFMGGPMPPDFAKKLAAEQAKAVPSKLGPPTGN